MATTSCVAAGDVVATQIVLNRPDWFSDPAFCAWLNGPTSKATWHDGGVPGEYSDVFVTLDAGLGGDGSDADMPFWPALVDAARALLGTGLPPHHPPVVVRITPA